MSRLLIGIRLESLVGGMLIGSFVSFVALVLVDQSVGFSGLNTMLACCWIDCSVPFVRSILLLLLIGKFWLFVLAAFVVMAR